MKPIPSFLAATLAGYDLRRLGDELFDLQRQTASGSKASDVKGYSVEAGRIVSVRTALAQNTARIDAANRLHTRFEVQDAAFTKVATAASELKQNIFTALSADDGSFLRTQLQSAFDLATDGLNTQHDGAPIFSGERRDVQSVNATTLDEVATNLATGALFNESRRDQTADVGIGARITVAPRVSTIATDLYSAFSDLNRITQGDALSRPLTSIQRNELTAVVERLDLALNSILTSQGKAGAAHKQLETGVERLEAHGNLLTKHLGEAADADLAEVAMKLSSVQTQYQAAASVFAQIKDLSLVNFLR